MTTLAHSPEVIPSLIKFNQTPVEKLFQKYEEIGFLYPAKKKLLKPHFSRIRRNWEKALDTEEQLLWILTNKEQSEKDFASVSVWRQSNHGLIAQHLVSSGNPFLSLKVMLAAQHKAEHDFTAEEVKSSQNWFRPNNRYAFRIFASMFDKLGEKKASLLRFQYLHHSLNSIAPTTSTHYRAEEVHGLDQELIDFVTSQYGEVFVRAEELDTEDIQLLQLGYAFRKYGLRRSRRVYKIRNEQSGTIVACVIGNKAPMGLNFSFLEHRAYFILDRALEDDQRIKICQKMLATVQPYYQQFPLGAIPIVTDISTSEILQKMGSQFSREYMQSIWLREGFSEWYAHIDSFLRRIERRG